MGIKQDLQERIGPFIASGYETLSKPEKSLIDDYRAVLNALETRSGDAGKRAKKLKSKITTYFGGRRGTKKHVRRLKNLARRSDSPGVKELGKAIDRYEKRPELDNWHDLQDARALFQRAGDIIYIDVANFSDWFAENITYEQGLYQFPGGGINSFDNVKNSRDLFSHLLQGLFAHDLASYDRHKDGELVMEKEYDGEVKIMFTIDAPTEDDVNAFKFSR